MQNGTGLCEILNGTRAIIGSKVIIIAFREFKYPGISSWDNLGIVSRDTIPGHRIFMNEKEVL
jgi:hypothetical protein